jgi:hypothetical protein
MIIKKENTKEYLDGYPLGSEKNIHVISRIPKLKEKMKKQITVNDAILLLILIFLLKKKTNTNNSVISPQNKKGKEYLPRPS